MNYNFSGVREALVIAPHPDDEALGCSGTLFQLNREGTSVTIAFLTSGEKLHGESSESVAEQRRREAYTCSDILGCREPVFLNYPDGEVGTHTQEIQDALREIMKKRRPEIIFSPSPVDYHADHIAASRIALRFLEGGEISRIAFYEIYSTLRFNCLIDITGVIKKKKEVILNYRSSLYGKPDIYIKASLGLNAHRSIFMQKEGYYEAFYVLEKPLELESIYDYLSYKDFSR